MRRLLACLAVCLALCASANAFGVMSVDLGSEWFKVGLVKPGFQMDLALNPESKRKTPVAVSIKDGEREFGNNAITVGNKSPELSWQRLQGLLGQPEGGKVVADFRARYPHYHIVPDPERGTVLFERGASAEGEEASPIGVEELVGMVFEAARAVADAASGAGDSVNDCVLTVPAYFTQVERQAVLDAAALAGLDVLQLMNDNAAVALNYAVKNIGSFSSTPVNVLFYDMGAGSTTASIVSFMTAKTKAGKEVPQVEVKAMAYDRTLGGHDFDLRLRDRLAELAQETKGVRSDVRASSRAMAKLLKEAKKRKEVLSANTETQAQVESLIDDVDFRAKLTRADFEALCEDLLVRVAGPLHGVLERAGMAMSDVSSVVLAGGGTRVPRVQTLLREAAGGADLEKSINADEAATLGALFQAASVSHMFRVADVDVRDAVAFPIDVSFEKPTANGTATKLVRKTLFPAGSAFPQKKVMTFTKLRDDFTLAVDYGDLDFLPRAQRELFPVRNITTYTVRGVSDLLELHKDDDFKGIKVHFALDASGMVSVLKAEAQFEVPPPPAVEEEEAGGIFSKMSSFFSGDGGEEEQQKEAEPETETETATEQEADAEGEADGQEQHEEEKEQGQEEAAAAEAEEDAPGDATNGSDGSAEEQGTDENQEEEKEEKEESEEKEDPASGDKEEEAAPAGEEEEKQAEKEEEKEKEKEQEKEKEEVVPPPKEQKPKKVKQSLEVDAKAAHGEASLSAYTAKVEAARATLAELNRRDNERRDNEASKNELESFIYATQDMLYDEGVQSVSTEEEREGLTSQLMEASDWLYDEGEHTTADVYRERMAEIKKQWDPISYRHGEARDLPGELNRLNETLTMVRGFVNTVRNMTEEQRYHTDAEVDGLEKVVNETVAWLAEKQEKQDAQPTTEDPVLTTKDVQAKVSKLGREFSFLAKKSKPKPKPKPKEEEVKKEEEENAKEEEKEKEDEDEAQTEENVQQDEDAKEQQEGGASDEAAGDAGAAEEGEKVEEEKNEENVEEEKEEEESGEAEGGDEEKKDEL